LQERDILTKVPRAKARYLAGGDQIVENDILTTDLWLRHSQATTGTISGKHSF